MNIVSNHTQLGYVPFFVKQYQKELTDLILAQPASAKTLDADQLYSHILTNPLITHQLLSEAFQNENKLNEESLTLSPQFLQAINLLKGSDTLSVPNKVLMEKCLNSIEWKSPSNVEELQEDEFQIPTDIKQIYQISNINRKKNKLRKKH